MLNLKKVIKLHKFRRACQWAGFSDEATQLFTYIHYLTKGGKEDMTVFEKKQKSQKLQIKIVELFKVYNQYVPNIKRLFSDSEFLTERYDTYKKHLPDILSRIDQHSSFGEKRDYLLQIFPK